MLRSSTLVVPTLLTQQCHYKWRVIESLLADYTGTLSRTADLMFILLFYSLIDKMLYHFRDNPFEKQTSLSHVR